MAHWTLDDIPWDRFDRAKVDPEILRIVKAASLVEQNGGDYAQYLCGVFADDPLFKAAAQRWGSEEIQHGQALGRWAALADPSFDHAAACARFTAGFRVDLDAKASVRGSRAKERIAADELRHYKLFLTHLERYIEAEGLGFWGRLHVALGRIGESEDDELAFAYHAANDPRGTYHRGRAKRAYARRAYAVYRRHHVERGMAMILKAVGLTPNGRLNRLATNLSWWFMRHRVARLEREAA